MMSSLSLCDAWRGLGRHASCAICMLRVKLLLVGAWGGCIAGDLASLAFVALRAYGFMRCSLSAMTDPHALADAGTGLHAEV